MTGWTPLYQQIIGSSVWSAPDHVRIAWITMLAICGKDGVAAVTTGGLARLANISREKAEDALRILSEPDADTLTQENEGRRIVRVENGWLLLNWAKYREKAKSAIAREQARLRQDKHRKNKSGSAATPEDVDEPAEETTAPVVRSKDVPLSVDDVIEFGKKAVPDPIPEATCRKFWEHYESQAQISPDGRLYWIKGNGTRLTNWREKLKSFDKEDRVAPEENDTSTVKMPVREV